MSDVLRPTGTNEIAPDVQRQQQGRYRYRSLYRTACLPDAEWQRCKLEALRYKWGGYRHAFRLMQVLGDFGRKHAPWLNFRLGPSGRMPQ